MRTLTLSGSALLLLAMLASPNPAVSQEDTPVVNTLDYMRNTMSPSGLCSVDTTHWPVCVHYIEQGNRLFYIKGEDGHYFERFTWDGTYVNLERDTTWKDAVGNNAYDAMPYGSLHWAKLSWSLNDRYNYSTHIVGYNNMGTGACSYAQHVDEYNDSNYKQLIFAGTKCWGGDVGCVDTIAILYPSGNEVHWYARGWGWVEWDNPIGTPVKVWNKRPVNPGTPTLLDNCEGTLGSWPAVFLNQDGTRNPGYGDWDFCHTKASCAAGETLNGVSDLPGGSARTALCRVQGNATYSGAERAVINDDAGDWRRAMRSINGSTDWDPGYFKLECGTTEYIAGTSDNATQCQGNTRFHAVLCAQAANPSAVCSVRPFDGGDNRVTTTSGDWDIGNYKGECGLTSYAAGISISPATGRPHALLCCHP